MLNINIFWFHFLRKTFAALKAKQVINSLNARSIPVLIRCITNKTEDVTIHTGQKWESDDYRLARFTLAPKQVNKNWAVNLIAEVPPMEVTEHVVWCDGGSGPEGHPRVYINVDKPGNHACGYCGLRFVKKDNH